MDSLEKAPLKSPAPKLVNGRDGSRGWMVIYKLNASVFLPNVSFTWHWITLSMAQRNEIRKNRLLGRNM
ncbi:hypothetical protein ACET3Z_006920 [Daucus carota]